MFIRCTQTRNTHSGESYHTYRLVRTERIGGKVKQLTLLNLGRHFDVDREEWLTLCAREAINERLVRRFERELDKIADGLNKPRTNKRLEKLWERIGRLKANFHGIGQHYEIELEADAEGQNAVTLKYHRKPISGSAFTHPGVYCLRCSETDWNEEKLWRTYIMLTDLEAVFRSLKSELGLRPVYHHNEARAEGHLFITVLAYQFVQIIRRRLRESGIHASWRTLRQGDGLSGAGYRCVSASGWKGFACSQSDPPGEVQHLEVCQALRMGTLPGGTEKLVH